MHSSPPRLSIIPTVPRSHWRPLPLFAALGGVALLAVYAVSIGALFIPLRGSR